MWIKKIEHLGICTTQLFLLEIIKAPQFSKAKSLLLEMQFPSRGTRGENLFQIFPGLLRRLRVSDMAEQLVSDTGCEAVHYPTCACSQAEESLCVASGAGSLALST